MDLLKMYKQNEILQDYINIYFDDDKEPTAQGNIKYKILDVIGHGVYGVVYKAYCLNSMCVVALKQTYQKHARIFKEVEIMKKLRHPNIVQLKHAFYTNTSNGGIYVHMIMEYGNTDLATSLYYISIQNSPDHVNTFYEPRAHQEGYAQNGYGSMFEEDYLNEGNFSCGTDNPEGSLLGNSNRLTTSQVHCPKGASGMIKNAVSSFNINALQESISHICPCHNISEYIKKSFLNENQIKIYLYQLIRATLYLHTLCITHRDIKPQNVLIFVNKQSSNGAAGGLKNGEKKKCLVCIQNSFKVKYIMNRRRRGEASDAALDQAAPEGDLSPNGITHAHSGCDKSESPSREPSCGASPTCDKRIQEDDSQNEPRPSEEGTVGQEAHSGDSHHWMQTTPCETSKGGAQRCSSRRSTPFSHNCDMNNLSTDDMQLNKSASMTMTQSFKDTYETCQASSKENTSAIPSKEGDDILPHLEVNSAHEEEEISLNRIYMNSITYKYIKLCDFNTSIKLKENYKYFSYVCSRYYRAPELLFGSNYYSQAIDTWSIGCVMGELILGKPLFLGNCASDQLVEIIKILGTPNDEDFLSFKSGHKNIKLPQVKPITLKKLIKNHSSQESIDLLGKLLQFNPQKRIKLCNALLHKYFDDIRNLNAFKDDRSGGSTFHLPYITNCFNFTKEELLHFTVEERKILIPLEVRRSKLDEVMQYIDMPLEHFNQMYPNKVHLAC
ncbi:CMGC/GSK protein kinase [Plasmodium fragile]|uniref:CMGC/GSK protein kinase n=1 Tax=Plasmodium fragile TaxID=5857 RepID=A0A0D9QR81_PLAFR|nr:CMGC/GSK protein kinase [Plasmodium fragile]KJP89590.1 CMGC/GSK protein kinase [Plasmodium fragile]